MRRPPTFRSPRRPLARLATSALGLLAQITILGVACSSAQAQVIPWPTIAANPNKPLYEQPRPDYDATGIDLGSFLFKPSVFESVSYDDDIFASEIHPANDWINTTGEEFDFSSEWSRHFLSVDLQSDQQVYTQHPQESANTYLGTIVGRYELSSDAYIELDGNGGQKPQERGSEEAFQPAGHRPIYNIWAGNLTYVQRLGQFVNEFRVATKSKRLHLSSKYLSKQHGFTRSSVIG